MITIVGNIWRSGNIHRATNMLILFNVWSLRETNFPSSMFRTVTFETLDSWLNPKSKCKATEILLSRYLHLDISKTRTTKWLSDRWLLCCDWQGVDSEQPLFLPSAEQSILAIPYGSLHKLRIRKVKKKVCKLHHEVLFRNIETNYENLTRGFCQWSARKWHYDFNPNVISRPLPAGMTLAQTSKIYSTRRTRYRSHSRSQS